MALAYPAHFADQAWSLVMGGIDGAGRELEILRPAFMSCFASGEPTRRLEREIADELAGHEWTWPWFEGWNRVFEHWGKRPYMWEQLQPDADEMDEWSPEELVVFRRAAIAPLIVDTAMTIAYRDLRLSKAQPKWPWRLVGIGDEVEDRVADQCRAAIEAGDLSRLPPYFPGDRTSLQQVSPYPRGH